eukprot:CAMPEP_0194276296 /NCGR_PEP_ID=MMETSP0169-20130528/8920_1 /TAXON_ID=218684 /ORGANISM="Corethron pennatum, Strain L29A3" /LENGTH=1536 /DNA_ID=CAMNT_0039019985 /DNA_START=113 /DNA_END=4723 /DNA_ORIENTATION=-
MTTHGAYNDSERSTVDKSGVPKPRSVDPINGWVRKTTAWDMVQSQSTQNNIARFGRVPYGRKQTRRMEEGRHGKFVSKDQTSIGNHCELNPPSHRTSDSSSSLSSLSDIYPSCGEREMYRLAPETIKNENSNPNLSKSPGIKMEIYDHLKRRDFSSIACRGPRWGTLFSPDSRKDPLKEASGDSYDTPQLKKDTAYSPGPVDPTPFNKTSRTLEASLSTSSNCRKRGVCASPPDTNDIGEYVIDSHGTPVERRRSRCRVLSPHKGAKEKNNELKGENYIFDVEHRPQAAGLNDVSFCSTVASLESDSDTSVDENDKNTSVNRNVQSFQSVPLFGGRNLSITEVLEGTPLFLSMIKAVPSFNDLRFLLRMMRSDPNGKKVPTFGVSSRFVTVAVPNQWNSERKAKFLAWSTTGESSEHSAPGLGFNLRAVGGNVFFLQIAENRAEVVQKFLELAFRHMKVNNSDRRQVHVVLKKKKSGERKKYRDSSVYLNTPRPNVKATVASTSFVRSCRDASSTLTKKMENLQVSVSSNIKAPNSSAKELLVRTVTLESASDLDQKNECFKNVMSPPTALHRACRIDYSADDPPTVQDFFMESSPPPRSRRTSPSPRLKLRQRPQKHLQDIPNRERKYLPGNSASPKLPLQNKKRRPRHSGEHSIGGQDLLLHMGCHGFTPKRENRKLHKTSSTPKQDYRSKRPDRIITGRLRLNSDQEFTPKLPQPSDIVPFTSGKLLDITPNENLETPLTRRKHYWGGSTDVDWGDSKKCTDCIIDELLKMLKDAASDCFCISHGNESDNFFDDDAGSSSTSSSVEDRVNALNGNQNDEFNEDRFNMSNSILLGNPSPNHKFTLRPFRRYQSVGSTQLASLNLSDNSCSFEEKKKKKSFAKHKRVSICAAAFADESRPSMNRFSVSNAPVLKNHSLSEMSMSMSPRCELATEKSFLEFQGPPDTCFSKSDIVQNIFGFFTEEELLCKVSLVCSEWATHASFSHASLMLASVGCVDTLLNSSKRSSYEVDGKDDIDINSINSSNSALKFMDKPWSHLEQRFPRASFLAEGGNKHVYRVWNSKVNAEEAVSVMDVKQIDHAGEKEIVGREMEISALLSSLSRRNICPNFVKIHGVFTCAFGPPPSVWGHAGNKKNLIEKKKPFPRQPSKKCRGKYQYIRMELCHYGDVEMHLKSQPNKNINGEEARQLLFQMAFALHVASVKFGLKHYDVKLLNFFLQKLNQDDVIDDSQTVVRYGIGEHIFCLRMPSSSAKLVKLADFGTSQLGHENNGKPITAAQYTTIENSPPEQLISGDCAEQGHGHDSFGLGLCMLHLFTGNAPYEEILESVVCPPNLRNALKKVWENASLHRNANTYHIVQSIILADVFEHEDGSIEGDPDMTVYDTLYRFLVLFGVPEENSRSKGGERVWNAISSTLVGKHENSAKRELRRSIRAEKRPENTNDTAPDLQHFIRDQAMFSLSRGTNAIIASARKKLEDFEGGMDLLKSLVTFDPNQRATALDVINSSFMSSLREANFPNIDKENDKIYSYTTYYTSRQ